MNTKLLLLVGAGVLGYYLYKKSKKDNVSVPKEAQIIGEEYVKTAKNYTNAFLMQYDIIVPPAQAAKAIRESGFALQEERKRVEQARMENKTPVYI